MPKKCFQSSLFLRLRPEFRAEKTYATVGTVSSSALLGGLVDLDVLDDQGTGIKTLGVGIGLGVLQELEQELGGLHGPPGAGDTKSLAYLSCRQLRVFIVSIHISFLSFITGRRDPAVFFRAATPCS